MIQEIFNMLESVRSGNSDVISRPVSFPPHPIPEGMNAKPLSGNAEPQQWAAEHLGYTWYL